MNPSTRRILFAALLVLFVIIVFLGIWFLFFAPLTRVPTNQSTNANTNATGQLPNNNVNRPANANNSLVNGATALPKPSDVANGNATLVSDLSSAVTSEPVIGPDGKDIIYYDDLERRFVRLDPETGQIASISDQRFPNVKKVTWSPDAHRAVLEFPDGSKIVYDFSSQKQFSLPKEAEDFSFSADSTRLAYKFVGLGPDESFLVTSNANGTGSKAVAKLADKAASVEVAWSPSDEVVGFYRKGLNASDQEIILIGQNDENFKTITTAGRGFQGRWTPDGNKVLYTVVSAETNWNPELHLVLGRGDQIGQGDVDIGLQTSLDKCAFNPSGTHAYCAVPDLMEAGSGLYPEFSSSVKDTLYTINLRDGSFQPVAQPVTGDYDRFTVGSLFLSLDESTLYFTDLATQRLHKIRLK